MIRLNLRYRHRDQNQKRFYPDRRSFSFSLLLFSLIVLSNPSTWECLSMVVQLCIRLESSPPGLPVVSVNKIASKVNKVYWALVWNYSNLNVIFLFFCAHNLYGHMTLIHYSQSMTDYFTHIMLQSDHTMYVQLLLSRFNWSSFFLKHLLLTFYCLHIWGIHYFFVMHLKPH